MENASRPDDVSTDYTYLTLVTMSIILHWAPLSQAEILKHFGDPLRERRPRNLRPMQVAIGRMWVGRSVGYRAGDRPAAAGRGLRSALAGHETIRA